MSLDLSPAELVRLTGRKWRKGQVAWLRAEGWRFTINGRGEVIVARAEHDAKLVSRPAPQSESAIRWGEVKHGRKAA